MSTRWMWRVAAVALSVLGMGVLTWLVLVGPGWVLGGDGQQLTVAERVTAEGSVRNQLIGLISALGALVVVAYGVYRYYLEKDRQRLDEDKHLTGLFDSAAGRLESENATVRAVAVRTLYRLMLDSPRDHMLVVSTLCDTLREFAVPPSGTDVEPRRSSPEVTAAAEALRDRPEREEVQPLDVRGIWLRGQNLRGIRLPGADFTGADLTGNDLSEADLAGAHGSHAHLVGTTLHAANLTEADLTAADLTGAVLTDLRGQRAKLTEAKLHRADLRGADLQGAMLRGAYLRGALLDGTDLTGADLTRADLTGTDLRGVRGLTTAQIRVAITDQGTALPDGVEHPDPAPGAE